MKRVCKRLCAAVVAVVLAAGAACFIKNKFWR